MLDKNALISDIYELKSIKKQLEDVIDKLKSTLTDMDNKITAKEEVLLSAMKEANITVNTEVEGIVAAVFKKENIGYKNESDVLTYLKSIGRNDLIRVKINENLDKIGIKKAIKTDNNLAESLASMTTHSTTEYVIVTSADSYSKMMANIEKGS